MIRGKDRKARVAAFALSVCGAAALVLGTAGGCAERRPDPVLVVRPPPTEAAGMLGFLPLPEGSVRLDAVPMPEQDLRHTPIPSGFWAMWVMAENSSPRDLPLNPALDRWTVVDAQGFATPAHPASSLHLGAYLDALPGGMRERVAYPPSIRAGARIRFPLFVPEAAGAGIREILFECRHSQTGARLRRPADAPVPVPILGSALADSVNGKAKLTKSGERKEAPLKRGDGLRIGDAIRVETDGRVVVWDRDGKAAFRLEGPETFEIVPVP